MDQQFVDNLKAWFTEYVSGFYGDDEYVNANIKLKEDHTHRTCAEMLHLAAELGLDPSKTSIAEAVALLHDIGRFEQFAQYRTYHDPRSTDHCALGAEVLARTGVLGSLDTDESSSIETAVRYHGCRLVPADLTGDPLLFTQMVRDIDKIDIFQIMTDNYGVYKKDPAAFMLEIELPDTPEYSQHVIDALLAEHPIAYSELRTLNDMMLCQLGWVYDVNFPATFRRINERRYLEQILGFLPATADIEKVARKVLTYVQKRICRPQ